MTPKRAIEILNPEHREHYDSIETVNEACRVAVKALKKQIPKKTEQGTTNAFIYACPTCGGPVGSLEVEEIWCDFCPKCGQALDWSDEE